MKRFEKVILCGFILTVVFSFLGFDASSASISQKVLRLHVLANSDSEYDQRIKLTVKDTVSTLTETLLTAAESREEAEAILGENLDLIETSANEKLSALHANYTAKAYVEQCYFPTREYEDFSLPAGEYQALRVILGEGEGRNWWCVVYPSLCSSASAEAYSGFSGGERDVIKGEHKISFKVYEWYQELVSFFRG